MKSRLRLLSAILVLFVCCMAFPAAAQEPTHHIEPNLANTPKDTFGTPPSEWDNKGMDAFGTPPSEWYSSWESNPALLNLQENYYFIASMFYKGSYTDFENDMSNTLLGGYSSTSDTSEKAVGNSTGADIGFLMRFNDVSSFGGLIHYRYDSILGYGDFDMTHTEAGAGMVVSGETARRSDAHTEGLTLLYDMDVSDVFSMGMGFTYLYTYDNINYDVKGSTSRMTGLPATEDVRIDREYIFNTHTLSPKFGFSITPTDRFTLNLSGSVDFYLGTMEKISRMYDSYYINVGMLPAGTTYSERLDDGDIEGYGYNAEADTEIYLTDELSLTYLASGSYSDKSWDIDGAVTGFFAPYTYAGIYHGPGSIAYENKEKNWHATGGAGLNYALARVTLNSLITYTHWENKTSYYENNNAQDLTGPYNAWFQERTREELDIISLKLGATARMTDTITFDVGVGYGFGWGDYRYDVSYNSPLTTSELTFGGSDGDTFHDLTAGGSLIYSPFDRLNISLSGSGRIPLDGKSYSLSGTSAGGAGTSINPLAWGGAGSRGYDSHGYNYGGNFSIGYEF